MLLAQAEENEELRRRLDEAERALADRAIEVQSAGSLAEASLRLNKVFVAADQAAQQYLENVRRLAQEGRLTA